MGQSIEMCSFTLASFPVSYEGLGISDAEAAHAPAFIASCLNFVARSLAGPELLPPCFLDDIDKFLESLPSRGKAIISWVSGEQLNTQSAQALCLTQSEWSEQALPGRIVKWTSRASPRMRSLRELQSSTHCGDWLCITPDACELISLLSP